MQLRRYLRRATIAVGVVAGLTCLYVAQPACPDDPTGDAIVVLGAAVWPDERPSPALARRIGRGIELWQAGRAPVLVPSGGLGRYPPAEAEIMARLARTGGVPEDAVIPETQATSTSESAERIRELADIHGWKQIILVSEPYHLRRASALFRAQGIAVQTACAPWGDQRWANAYQTMREAGGLLALMVGIRTA